MSYAAMNLRERPPEAERKKQFQESEESFDQESKKPVNRSKKRDGRRARFDAQGIHKATQLDLCDCMDVECDGCFFSPCPKCGSHKCGHVCRRNRRWEYESISIEGTSVVIKNQAKK